MKQNSLLDKIRRVLSILLNLAVVRMEPIAIRMSWEAVGEQSLTFYTENSNLFSAAVCLLVAVCQVWALLSGRALPRWVKRLKFIAACCLTLTFLTVVFVLAPYYPDEGGVVFLLTESSMLYHHLLNPVFVFVSFWNGSRGSRPGTSRWRWCRRRSTEASPCGPTTSVCGRGHTPFCWCMSRRPGRRCCGARASWPGT